MWANSDIFRSSVSLRNNILCKLTASGLATVRWTLFHETDSHVGFFPLGSVLNTGYTLKVTTWLIIHHRSADNSLKCNHDSIYMSKEVFIKRTKRLIPSSFSSNAGLIIPGSGASLVGFRDRDECLASAGASPSPLRPFISFHEGLFRLSASSFSRLKTGHLQKNKNVEETRAAMKHKDKYTQ